MTGVAFQPERLRLARELRRLTQSGLASELGLSAPAISQFESGATRPAEDTVVQLAACLEVPPAFFDLATPGVHEGFFRSLKRTSVADRRRARALAHVAHDLAADSAVAAGLPALSLPGHPVSGLEAVRGDVEAIAGRVRAEWGLAPGPIDDMVHVLEARGVVVIRLPLGTADVDAFSLPFADRPVIVLGADKNDRARSRFDLAHELGHLVMHGEELFGLKEVEQQAHWFAAAFLMPAETIGPELPDTVSWSTFFDLKTRWQVSLAALLMRAKTLGVLSQAQYLTAIKAASARGWRRREPIDLGEPEAPTLLRAAVRSSADRFHRTFPPGVLAELDAATAR